MRLFFVFMLGALAVASIGGGVWPVAIILGLIGYYTLKGMKKPAAPDFEFYERRDHFGDSASPSSGSSSPPAAGTAADRTNHSGTQGMGTGRG